MKKSLIKDQLAWDKFFEESSLVKESSLNTSFSMDTQFRSVINMDVTNTKHVPPNHIYSNKINNHYLVVS